MWKAILDIGAICVMMSVGLVFAIEWGKKLRRGVIDKEWGSVKLSIAVLAGGILFGAVAYYGFLWKEKEYGEWIILIITFLIVGMSQLIWENYNYIKKAGVKMAKKKLATLGKGNKVGK